MGSTAKLAILALFGGALAHADLIVLKTDSIGLGSNETVFWTQLGSDGASVPHSFSATSSTSETVSGSFSTTTGMIADVGLGWGPPSGTFAENDALVWAFDTGSNSGTGPVTFTLPNAGYGVGASVQADNPGQFTAKLQLFNGLVSLGSVTLTSDVAGDAIFLGALDTSGSNVTSATFSLTAAQSNSSVGNNLGDFAIDTLNINEVAGATPEPASFLLMGSALLGLGWKFRSRIARS